VSTRRKITRKRQQLLDEAGRVGRALSDAVVMFHTALAEKHGLGPSDWKMIGLLERRGALSAGELSELSGLAPPSVTGILDRLENWRWVQRTRDPADKRRVLVELNPDVLTKDLGSHFRGLMRRLSELYEQYSDQELASHLEFMREVARRQFEATVELTQG
jgi:DNA-binding MarR family transcriptional regulator